jgi:hypothetical protein
LLLIVGFTSFAFRGTATIFLSIAIAVVTGLGKHFSEVHGPTFLQAQLSRYANGHCREAIL